MSKGQGDLIPYISDKNFRDEVEENQVKLQPREWLCSGGWGHEGGEDGIRAMTLTGDALVDALECYREYLEET